MLGRGIRGLIRGRQHVREPARPPKDHASERKIDNLIAQFNALALDQQKKTIYRNITAPILGVYFQRRFFSSKIPSSLKSKIEWDHLNSLGQIKPEILDQRKAFLKKHHLLQDEFRYRDRIVYANKHLYSLDQKDTLGRTNLERMQKGFCPIDKTGKDIIVIHHFDQTHSGPWVILTNVFHQLQSDDLHSFVFVKDRVIRSIFNNQRANYWKYQAECALKSKPQLK